MKAIKEKLHKQISRNHKANLFASKRKELQFIREMNSCYCTILENNLDLMILIKQYGYANFYKYCCQVIDGRLLTYILCSQNNLLINLEFFQNLICLDLLCQISIVRFFFLLSNVLNNHLQNSKLIKIIQNVKCLLKKNPYHKIGIDCIKSHKTLDLIFDIVITNQKSSLIYSLIELLRSTCDLQCINIKKLVHCLQVHILTSSDQNQLFQTYKFLGEIFDHLYTVQDQLSQYGSIINKMFNDVEIQFLIQPISLFLSKGIKNFSILKFLVSMGSVVNLSSLLIKIYSGVHETHNSIQFQGQNHNKISIFSQQSLWRLFKILIEQTIKKKEQKIITLQIEWKKLKNITIYLLSSKQIYLKNEINFLIESISKIQELKQYFLDVKLNLNNNSWIGQGFQYAIKRENQLNFPQNFQYFSLQNYKYQN